MRITLLLSFLLSASEAFVTTSQSPLPRRPAFFALKSRADATSAIENAQQATAKYGADSPEARLAWEAVEEIDGSDNRYVFPVDRGGIENCQSFRWFAEDGKPVCRVDNNSLVHSFHQLSQPNSCLLLDICCYYNFASMITALPFKSQPSTSARPSKRVTPVSTMNKS